jgi:hypothetical protein
VGSYSEPTGGSGQPSSAVRATDEARCAGEGRGGVQGACEQADGDTEMTDRKGEISWARLHRDCGAAPGLAASCRPIRRVHHA